MIGQVNDLVESVKYIDDGASRIPNESVGIIKRVDGEYYKIQWIKINDYVPDYVWHKDRFRIITHGRIK